LKEFQIFSVIVSHFYKDSNAFVPPRYLGEYWSDDSRERVKVIVPGGVIALPHHQDVLSSRKDDGWQEIQRTG
jgi:hypothetical protein